MKTKRIYEATGYNGGMIVRCGHTHKTEKDAVKCLESMKVDGWYSKMYKNGKVSSRPDYN